MKKITAALLAAALLFSLSSCGSWRPSDSDDAGSQQENTVPGSSTVPSENETPETEEKETMNNRPVVYMTTDISPQGLMAVYKAMGWTPTGKVAVKLSTGEPPASNYLDPDLIADLVRTVDGTIVECNTAYGGSRAETAMHYQVAEDHGFTAIADFQIQDENGSMTLLSLIHIFF